MKRAIASLAMASILLASVASASQSPRPKQTIRLPTWEEAGWICLSIIASSASAGVGAAAAATIQTIGLLGIAASGPAAREPEIQPAFFLTPGPQPPGPAVLEAMSSLNPSHLTPSGTPAEMEFIERVNTFVDRGLELKTTTDPDSLRSMLNEMSIALEEAATAYDATGLTLTISQAAINAFKTDCADSTCAAFEDSVLAAAGLTLAQRQTLSAYFSTVELNLAQPTVSASALVHQGAQHLRQLALWKGVLKNAGNFFAPCTTPFAVCCSGDWEVGTATAAEVDSGYGNAGAYVDTAGRLRLIFHQPTALANGTIPIPGNFAIGSELSGALGYSSVVLSGGTYPVDFSTYSEFGEVAFETAELVGVPSEAGAGGFVRLGSSYPNPARVLSVLTFTTTAPGTYQVQIVDAAGRIVRRLYDRHLEPGEHRAQWDGADGAGRRARGGVYFYVLRGEGRELARKVTLL